MASGAGEEKDVKKNIEAKTLPPPTPPKTGGELKAPPLPFKEGVGGGVPFIYF